MRRFLIVVGVIAAVVVGAWVLVINPAINTFATEQLQAAGLEGATVEVHADGAKITMPTLPASFAGESGITASNLVFEFGGLGVDDIEALLSGADAGKLALPEGTRFSMTADRFSEFTDFSMVGTEKTAQMSGIISPELAVGIAEGLKDGDTGLLGLPITDIELTEGPNGTIMTATVDIAALLAAQNP